MPSIWAMSNLIDELGGPTKVARMTRKTVPSVIEWRTKGIPAARAPDIERGTDGRYTVEVLCPGVRFVRVPDPAWPHPQGRPCLDVASQALADTGTPA